MDLLEGTERWEASPHQARQSAEGLNEMTMDEVLRLHHTMAGRSGLNPLPGSTAGCGKPHVRWCGRVTARNHCDPTRSLKAQTDQRQLAGGRDLHWGERQLALPLPGGGFFRRDPRLPSLGQTGRSRSKALSDQSARQSKPYRRRESSTPTSMPLTRRRLCNSKTRVF